MGRTGMAQMFLVDLLCPFSVFLGFSLNFALSAFLLWRKDMIFVKNYIARFSHRPKVCNFATLSLNALNIGNFSIFTFQLIS